MKLQIQHHLHLKTLENKSILNTVLFRNEFCGIFYFVTQVIMKVTQALTRTSLYRGAFSHIHTFYCNYAIISLHVEIVNEQ